MMVNVTLVGITHIDVESQEKVSKALEELQPDAVCLELDEYRLQTLLENEFAKEEDHFYPNGLTKTLNNNSRNEKGLVDEKGNSFIDEEPLSSILVNIGFFEGQLVRITNSDLPGREMLIAYKAAKKMGLELFLIDRSINDISNIMKEEVSYEEATKFQEIVDELIFEKKIVTQPNNNSVKTTKDKLENLSNQIDATEINLNEVLEILKDRDSLMSILSVFQETFPKLYSILLEDRNAHMANEILKVAKNFSNIVVILGYGHVLEVATALKKSQKSINVTIR